MSYSEITDVASFVSGQKHSFETENVNITDVYEINTHDLLETIENYYNSRFDSGNTDELGREKPFYNINKFRVNVATRATDIDTKDIQLQASHPKHYIKSFLLSRENRQWMKRTNFARFLNQAGHARPKYGSVIVKKTGTDEDMYIEVVPIKNMIFDQIDFYAAPQIERHYYSPQQLKKTTEQGWGVGDFEGSIDKAIELSNNTIRKTDASSDDQAESKTSKLIEVYEVHGEMPETLIDENGDPNNWVQQMHIIVLNEDDDDLESGITLYKGAEKASPYKKLDWDEQANRSLGVGVVEDLIEAQVWTNYSSKQKKDMLDMASKMVFQATSASELAQNILTDVDNGEILISESPITQVNNAPRNLPAFDSFSQEWDNQAERVTSTFNAVTGETMPSGTPYRQVAILNQEAGSIFAYRREEMGIFIKEMYEDWIIPHLKARLKKKHVLVSDFSPEELDWIDEAYANERANNQAIDIMLSGRVLTRTKLTQIVEEEKAKLAKTGSARYLDIPDNFYDDEESSVDVITTGEQQNKGVILETLSNLLLNVAQNPALLQDPTMRRLFNKIIETSGLSPIEFQAPQQTTQALPALPNNVEQDAGTTTVQ